MSKVKHILLSAAVMALSVGISTAQFGGGGGGQGYLRGRGGRGYGGEYSRGNEPIDIPLDRNGVADWGTDPQFKNDNFTFVRLRFMNAPVPAVPRDAYRGGKTSWLNDWPDGDVN
ncbi:MAG TPA: hypothetical protein VGN88_03990, partial [Phycisphaerae bacterium]